MEKFRQEGRGERRGEGRSLDRKDGRRERSIFMNE